MYLCYKVSHSPLGNIVFLQIGPETIEFAYNGTYYPNYPILDRISIYTGFYVGYGHAAEFAVFEKDCITSITDIPFNTSIYEFRQSFAETELGIHFSFDVDTVESSVIYNSESWKIEVCVVVNLKESPDVKVEQVFSIFHAGSKTPVSTIHL